MASGWYNRALKEVSDRTLDLTGTLKVLLVGTGYTYDPDHDFISSGAGTVGANEISATNYTGGFGGSGRNSVTLSFSEQDANNRAVMIFSPSSLTWTALGGAANDTIAAAVVVKEGTSDADSKLIAYLDVTDTTTNGTDIQLTFDATNGNLRLLA